MARMKRLLYLSLKNANIWPNSFEDVYCYDARLYSTFSISIVIFSSVYTYGVSICRDLSVVLLSSLFFSLNIRAIIYGNLSLPCKDVNRSLFDGVTFIVGWDSSVV